MRKSPRKKLNHLRISAIALMAVLTLSGCAVDRLKELDVVYDLTQQDQIDAANGTGTMASPAEDTEDTGAETAGDADQPAVAGDSGRNTPPAEGTTDTASAPAAPSSDLQTEDIESVQEKMELKTTHLSREELEREDEKAREAIGLTEDRISDLMRDNRGKYYFEHMDNVGKRLYAELYQIITQRGQKIKVSSMDDQEVDTAYRYLMADHPELFSVDGYTRTRSTADGELVKLGFTARYLYEPDEEKRRGDQIEEIAAQILADAPTDSDQYYRVKYIYDYIIDHTEYDIGSPDNQNICSVLLNGRSVCQGYAKTAQFLLNRMGIQTTLVTGTVNVGDNSGAHHAWNLVTVNGNEYYLDVTWGDSSFQQEAASEAVEPRINYDYLLDTTADLTGTHNVGDLVEMPVCTHLEDNYYVRDGAYFTKVDAEQIRTLFEKAYREERKSVTVKCADDGIYEAMEQALITDKGIFDYLSSSADTASFAMVDSRRTITFQL